MKMYKTNHYSFDIIENEIDSTTKSFVFYTNRHGQIQKEKKFTHYSQWHESHEAAVSHLRSKVLERLEFYEDQLRRAKENLELFDKQYNP